MDLVLAWLIFPALLAALLLGCGLLVEALAGRPVPGALLPGLGLAAVIVAGQFTTLGDATAELTAPLVVGMAVAGFLLAARMPLRRPTVAPLAAAGAVFAVFGAPVVLSGEATLAGYVKLDDTATWLAITDHVMEHGRDLSMLAPSSYEATLDVNLSGGYPVGAFVPLGVGAVLTGSDPAWIFQPYLALLAGLLSLALWSIAAPLVRPSWQRALVAFAAAQPALLFAYAMWGGIKELEAAVLVALTAALAGGAATARVTAREAIPLAVAAAALLAVLGLGGGAWLLGLLVPAGWVALRAQGRGAAVRALAWSAGAAAVLSLPLLAVGDFFSPTQEGLTSADELGNLIEPLGLARLAGIWPAGDFRTANDAPLPTGLLIAAAVAAAAYGLHLAHRRGASPGLVYGAGALLGAGLIILVGSPWVDGKALATASPVVPLLAGAGACGLAALGRRWEAGTLAAALLAGVVWSNALAYRDVSLAPREQLAELEEIGEEIAGQGPALMTEYNPYGVRHFLREADPEGASELRRRSIPLAGGEQLAKGDYADTDELSLPDLLAYRTLVLRRSPGQSRPPGPYELVSRDEFYEVWQRPPAAAAAVTEHLPLGGEVEAASVPACADVRALAARAAPGEVLAASVRPPVNAVPLDSATYPFAWLGEDPAYPVARSAGTIEASVSVPEAGEYDVWLGGSLRPEARLRVDGEEVATARHQLNNLGQYVPFGTVALDAGEHRLEIEIGEAGLAPGSGGPSGPLGPLVLSPTGLREEPLVQVAPAAADELCGRPLDWIERLAP